MDENLNVVTQVNSPTTRLLGGVYDPSKNDAYLGTILTFIGDPGIDPENPPNVELYDPGLLVLTGDPGDRIIHRVERVEPNTCDSEKYNTYDYSGHVIMAGFVDTHVHYVQMDAIAAFGEQVLQWLKDYIYPAEKKFKNVDHCRVVAEFFLDTLLVNGTTTASVYCTQPADSTETFFEVAHKRNMRMLTGKMLMDSQEIPEDLRDENVEDAINSSRELAKKWHGRGRQLYSVNPRFAINCTEYMLEKSGEHYKEIINGMPLWMHTHLSENKEEEKRIKRLFKNIMGRRVPGGDGPDDTVQTYTDVYRYYGLVGPRAIFGHCIEINSRDRRNLSNAGSSIAHCPTSNFFLGSGMFNLGDALANHIRVGMGTDCGAGTSYSLLTTMGASYKSQAIYKSQATETSTRTCYPKLTAWRAFYLATLGGAKALYLDKKTSDLNTHAPIGSLQPGNAADFIILDLAATPVIKRRLEQVEPHDQNGNPRTRWSIWHEKLFALMTLGDDRVIKATYIMGEQAHDRDLPPGVIKLNDGEKCPSRTLCLYNYPHYQGPAYAIRAGYDVDLNKLNMNKTVSSWVNRTQSTALLIGCHTVHPLNAGCSLEETKPTVEKIGWVQPCECSHKEALST
jgi:guanine deaminase